jgi:carboxypeptidase C (cathepsin A)
MYNLYAKYPEFNGKRLYIAGESYAGKYLPAISVALHEAGFNLHGSLIGDPLSFPVSQLTTQYPLALALNDLDSSNMR